MDGLFIVHFLVGWISLTIGVLMWYQLTNGFKNFKELLTNRGFKLFCAGFVMIMGGVVFLLLLFKN